MHVIVLGAGAGGGLPQWNCGCQNCAAARAGDIPSMTQSSIAVSADGETWALINASPDLRVQLAANVALHPTGLRESPLRAALVTNGDIDHIAGLLTLRENQPFDLYATPAIHDILAVNPVFSALNADLVMRMPVATEEPFDLLPGLRVRLFSVPGKVPLYLEDETVQTDLMGEQTVGVELTTSDRRICYIPGCAALPDWLQDRISGSDLLLFDGTLWDDDEMLHSGLGVKTGRRMGHVPVHGPGGALETLADLSVGQKVLIHINNSNPLTDPRSAETGRVRAAGWQVAFDGMEITA